MKKPNIAFYGLWGEMAAYTKQKLKKFQPRIFSEIITLKNLRPDTSIIGVFVESQITKEVLKKLPHLKLIATMSTGYNHIDVVATKKRQIPVCTVPTYGENTVAEHTFALILGLTRKLFHSVKRVKEGIYDFKGLTGVDLKGKTLGVIGTGHIGAHVIRIAKGFEMNVLAYDVHQNKKLTKQLGFSYTTLPRLLASADIVSLHTPLLPSTYHLINKKNIKKMKRGAYLINTARGALIDPEALVWALEKKYLAGVGLDVLEDENLIQNHEQVIRCTDCQIKTTLFNNIIIDHPNTIVTPHNAFNSTEAIHRIVDVTVDNILCFLSGKPQNIIR